MTEFDNSSKTDNTNKLIEFASGKPVDLFHSTVHYARAYLMYCTDFVEVTGRKPTLRDCEQALVSLKWLRPGSRSSSAKGKRNG